MHLIQLDKVSPTSNPQSDNNPLTYVLTTAKLDATGQRWVAALSRYKFSIKNRSGKKNADVGRLSRCKHPQEEKTIFPNMLKAVSHSLSVMDKDCSLVESLAVSPAHVSKQILEILEQLLQTYGLTFTLATIVIGLTACLACQLRLFCLPNETTAIYM